MDFFENQDRARRKSALLLFYFGSAICLIVVAINLVAWLGLQLANEGRQPLASWLLSSTSAKIALLTLSVIAGGSALQFRRLRTGGEAVAFMAGATPIDMQSPQFKERQLINIVEEMSIAAGVIMPQLFVMEQESGINAFVAGYEPNRAVLVVTKGALQHLERDELQGVIGHEFSHILNGDMRINIRLIALLAGILLLGQIGEFLLRSTRHMRRSRDSAKAAPFFLAGGVGLTVIGYIGLFFGRLIKAAISRQREFLADASAVQFTRNPQGLAGALHRIQTSVDGSALRSTLHAEDMSHMCFGETVTLRFQELFASHPPLDERIRAIDPTFMAIARSKRNRNQQQRASASQHDWRQASSLADQAVINALATPAAIIAQAGHALPHHFDYASRLLASWPEALKQLMCSPSGAQSVIAAVLMSDMGDVDHHHVLAALEDSANTSEISSEALQQALSATSSLERASRLPIIERCIAQLIPLSVTEKRKFLQFLERLVHMDHRCTIFEFAVLALVQNQLQARSGKPALTRFRSFEPVLEDIRCAVGMMSRVSSVDSETRNQAFARTMAKFSSQTFQLPLTCSATELGQCLSRLATLTPLLKRPVLEACADLAMQDGILAPKEYELLRAIAETLDCPLPPLTTG